MTIPHGFPQSSVTANTTAACLGMPRNAPGNSQLFGALPAMAVVQPGDVLEKVLSGGVICVRGAQSANGALAPLCGVALYKDARMPATRQASTTTGYQIGESVPYMRRGQIYAKFVSTDGATAQVLGGVANYEHSTTLLAEQAAFTDKATASTTGHEVDAVPGAVFVKDVTATLGFGFCLVDLNWPAGAPATG